MVGSLSLHRPQGYLEVNSLAKLCDQPVSSYNVRFEDFTGLILPMDGHNVPSSG